jgi:hypothetical protein
MHCPLCGTEQPEGTRFCKVCNEPMTTTRSPRATTAPPSMAASPPPVASPGYPAPPPTAVKPKYNRTPIILGLAAVVVVVIVVVVLVATLGGESSIYGEYWSGATMIELKPDGILGTAGDMKGTYTISGNKIILRLEAVGYNSVNHSEVLIGVSETEGIIEDGKITTEGEVYIKR